jgi:hypothetical protein
MADAQTSPITTNHETAIGVVPNAREPFFIGKLFLLAMDSYETETQ